MNKTLPLTLTALLLPGAALAHLEYYDLNKMYRVADLKVELKTGTSLPLYKFAEQLSQGNATLEDLSADGLAIYNSHDTPRLDATYDDVMNGAWTFASSSEGCQLGEADCVRSVTVKDLNLSGWIDGTGIRGELPTKGPEGTGAYYALGDSHVVDFANFHLDHDAYVTIDFSATTGINPSFTLYKGLLAYQGHDEGDVDPANPIDFNDPATPRLASVKDDGTHIDWQGHLSPFRDTLHNDCGDSCQYAGQFDALHSWSQSNISGTAANNYWSVVRYITHVTANSHTATRNTLQKQCLKAGDYTIAFSGAGIAADNTVPASNQKAPPGVVRSGLTGTLNLSAETTDSCDNLPPTVTFDSQPVLVDEGDEVILTANASDPNGDTLSYQWEQIAGPSVPFDATNQSPRFVAPEVAPNGADLTFKLTVTDNAAPPLSANATVTFHVRDRYDALNCAYAAPSKSTLWPANKDLVPIGIVGVDGPNAITLKITGVSSDEPVRSKPARDSTGPDARIRPGKASKKRPDTLDSLRLRAERQRKGNGRVYTVNFRATDTSGQTCTGKVQVSVPPRKGATAIEDSKPYNALLKK